MSNLIGVSELDTHMLLSLDDGKANALSFAMFDALHAGLDQAAAAGKVVVIAGRPGKFSAGFDLAVMREGGDATQRLLRRGADTAARLMAFDTPVVLAVSGHALAMGALLCLSADYRVGLRGDYKIGLNEAAIGMTLPWFGVELARARLAQQQLNAAIGLAQIYDPDMAVSAGFLDEVVDEVDFLPRVMQIAESSAALSLEAHRGSKARVREEFFRRYAEALRRDFD